MVPYKENLSERKYQSSHVYWIEELMISHNGDIYLFFINREPRHAYNQLMVLIKAYERVLGHDHRKIRFRIVVANDRRKAEYLRVINGTLRPRTLASPFSSSSSSLIRWRRFTLPILGRKGTTGGP